MNSVFLLSKNDFFLASNDHDPSGLTTSQKEFSTTSLARRLTDLWVPIQSLPLTTIEAVEKVTQLSTIGY
jgi:Leucine-rich repeat (LRR) protein